MNITNERTNEQTKQTKQTIMFLCPLNIIVFIYWYFLLFRVILTVDSGGGSRRAVSVSLIDDERNEIDEK